MATTEHKRGKEIITLDGGEIVITELRCPLCNSTISLMTFNQKLTLKCKCRMNFVYPENYVEGRMSMITKEMHQERLMKDGEE